MTNSTFRFFLTRNKEQNMTLPWGRLHGHHDESSCSTQCSSPSAQTFPCASGTQELLPPLPQFEVCPKLVPFRTVASTHATRIRCRRFTASLNSAACFVSTRTLSLFCVETRGMILAINAHSKSKFRSDGLDALSLGNAVPLGRQ